MMQCIIVDDEAMAIKVIESHMNHVDDLQLQATFTNAVEAFTYLQQHQIDILFLDIQMPKMSGLTLLKSLAKPPKVILTTAHRNFALESYELDVVDYLVKPIAFDRFLQAVGKVLRLLSKQSTPIEIANPTESKAAFFYVKSDRQYIKVLLDEVLYMESLRNHLRIKTVNGDITTLMSISEMEGKLPPQHFIRIHRSFIIGIDKVERFTQSNLSIGDKTLPIGNHYRRAVLQRLEEHTL
ncbi:MAG: LytTR family DNA-binding domain-containing protein [Bacteroidota bacterium]